jgi:hypothetical protein
MDKQQKLSDKCWRELHIRLSDHFNYQLGEKLLWGINKQLHVMLSNHSSHFGITIQEELNG